jgi:hypothetical protein
MAYSENTAIVPVPKGEAVSKDLTLAEAVAKKKRNKAASKLKRKGIAESDAGYSYISFHFANGGTTTYKANTKSVRTMLLPTPKPDKGKAINVRVDAAGKVIGNADVYKLMPIQVSFGKSQKKNKKTGKNRLVQSYKTVSVPAHATLTDVAHWLGKWGKKPAILRFKGQVVVIDPDRAKKGAGAVG